MAALCAISATLLTVFEIFKHLQNYEQPSLQRYIVRLLWLVPIYAMDSLISLLYPEHSIIFDTIRDCYESFVLYSFFSLLLAYLGPDRDRILEELPATAYPWPCCWLPWVQPDRSFLMTCRRAILQFVFIKPTLSILALVLDLGFGVYDETDLSMTSAYLWITVCVNISVSISFYFLVMFSLIVREPLRRVRPVPKFLCIKAVVFFSWWQGVAINLLVQFGVLVPVGPWSVATVANAVQDTLICIEMLIIAIAHLQVFGYHQFLADSDSVIVLREHIPDFEFTPLPLPPSTQALIDVLTVTDVIDDTKEALKHVKPTHPKHH
ncbi:MAG: OSTA/TMEM184 family protein [archaeon]|nr:OSTA/TMEM184 family protein [archaeon]